MQPDEVKFKQAKPTGTIDQIFEIDCVAKADERQANIDYAAKLNIPRVVQRKRRPGKVAIVASGPSVTDYVDLLKDWDGEIWCINRALEWARHRGIKPTAFIGVDPEWFLVECIPNPTNDITYYIASQVHRGVWDHLAGKNVRLWFMADGQVRQPFGAVPIHGGSTALSRAPNLAWLLGWREVHIFGGDSSFTHKSHVHGGEIPPNWVPTQVGDRIFKTTRTMLSQACEYVEQMAEWSRGDDPLSVTLYGDGLMQALYQQATDAGNYEQYLYEMATKDRGMNRKQRRAMA